ncbi:MAG: phosphoribosylglycinamide formyltransferase [Myxococcales bacterium]|nr:phosphoribosylglycinamide formyltransferase [Myxococcales bacterium]
MNVAVLASGGGTNLQALLDAQAQGRLAPARVTVVGVNVAGCGALARAEAAGVPTFVLPHGAFPDRGAFDTALLEKLRDFDVSCVVLAGFMRLLTPAFLDAFPDGVLNVHPALLPAFPGLHAQKQAFEAGVKFAGCTVHFVDAGVDSGPIVAQAVVPVLPDDTAETLQQRILRQEHALLPAVVRAHAEGRVRREGRRVQIDDAPRAASDAALSSL